MYKSKLLKKTTALKYADVRPAFKKDKTDKENYRPISILPNLSKVYESLMYDQMYPYSDQIFSKLQCGFRKGFNAEQCLINIVEKCRNILILVTTTVPFSQTSPMLLTIDHQLLIVKQNAYGVDTNPPYFLTSYLEATNKWEWFLQ